MAEDKQFYVGQKAFIDKGGRVLMLHDPIEGLDFPGGKVQEGETNFEEALKREVREETGLEIEVGEPFAVWDNVFPPQHRNAGKHVFLVAFRCSYKSGEVRLSEEHDRFRWINKTNYKEVDDSTNYFKVLEKYFKNY
ncbi:MAG: NUDIX domain-containing protein [bacterium]|nr:NUDIX domain-containing protein [bacterium]